MLLNQPSFSPFLPPYKNRPAPYKIINGDTVIPGLH